MCLVCHSAVSLYSMLYSLGLQPVTLLVLNTLMSYKRPCKQETTLLWTECIECKCQYMSRL